MYIKVREKQERCEYSQDDAYRQGGKRKMRALVGLAVLKNQTIVGRARLLPLFHHVEKILSLEAEFSCWHVHSRTENMKRRKRNMATIHV